MPFIRTLSAEGRKRLCIGLGGAAVTLLITLGVFASNDWLPKTDPMTGKRFGWFGKPLASNAPSSWNPIAAALPSPTPTPLPLSKEYLYAGSRLLAVEDANATAAPPADIAVWSPSNGWWAVKGQTGSQATGAQWGISTDIPVPADYDGDGKTDFAVYRAGSSSVFYVVPSGGGSAYAAYWGIAIDKPASGDFDGDGKSDIVIARPNTSGSGSLDWWISKSSDSTYYAVSWGLPTDALAVADYDGDGIADRAVYRSSDETFYIIRSSDGTAMVIDIGVTVSCSAPKQCIVPSDYDGDGKADPAVFDPSTATWHVYRSTTDSIVSQVWGNNGTSGCTGACSNLFPVQNDYDLDGKTDFAVWDNAASAVWTIRRSSNGSTRTETFGTTGDIPVPAFYRR